MAVFLGLNTLGRLGIVQSYGPASGVNQLLAYALLAIVGAGYMLAAVGAFFLLGIPRRLHWWLVLAMPVIAWVNIAVAVAVLPAQEIGVGTVFDVYLFNGLLPLVVSGLLLKRAIRRYFGVARSANVARAA